MQTIEHGEKLTSFSSHLTLSWAGKMGHKNLQFSISFKIRI